jgi:hypothetical protein
LRELGTAVRGPSSLWREITGYEDVVIARLGRVSDLIVAPRSVAVVGGSPRPTSPGRAVLKNLRSAGFKGSISLVNPHYSEIEGIPALLNITVNGGNRGSLGYNTIRDRAEGDSHPCDN